MEAQTEGWISRLENGHAVYRRLRSRHENFKQRLGTLAHRRVISEQERLEEVRLKKEKLFLKDRMAAIARAVSPSVSP